MHEIEHAGRRGVAEERLNLLSQFLVAATGLRQKRRPRLRRFPARVVKPLDVLPTVRRHARWDPRPILLLNCDGPRSIALFSLVVAFFLDGNSWGSRRRVNMHREATDNDGRRRHSVIDWRGFLGRARAIAAAGLVPPHSGIGGHGGPVQGARAGRYRAPKLGAEPGSCAPAPLGPRLEGAADGPRRSPQPRLGASETQYPVHG